MTTTIDQRTKDIAFLISKLNKRWPKYLFYVGEDNGQPGIFAKIRVQDRSKYMPHQGKQECARRRKRITDAARQKAMTW